MTFEIKKHGAWNEPYWKKEIKSKKKLFSTSTCTYMDLDATLFKDILRDELDVPDYTINAKNINKEFGFTDNGRKIPEDCIKQIVNYYKWRKELFDRIVAEFVDCTSFGGIQDRFEALGCDEIRIRFNIPAKYNNFSTEEVNYTGNQVAAYLEVAIRK